MVKLQDMQDIEPYFRWREKYVAAKDPRSPFFGKVYDEFKYTKKVYNYYIHPQANCRAIHNTESSPHYPGS